MGKSVDDLIREGARLIFESRGVELSDQVIDRVLDVIKTGVPTPPAPSTSGWASGEMFDRVDNMRLMAEARAEELNQDVQARDEVLRFITRRLQQQIRLGRRQLEEADEEEQIELVETRVKALEETLITIAAEKSKAGIDLEE